MNAPLPTLDHSPTPQKQLRLAPVEGEYFLHQIPSETSVAERRLLFRLFANEWNGAGAVVEIGPFLGGTTRAIATGMTANPHYATDARVHTFDRFDAYYSAERLRTTIQPMVDAGVFTSAEADDLCRDANFERLFHAIHTPHRYGAIVDLHNSPLPDLPDEIDRATSFDCLAPDLALGALFVDGCKSWASTHYALTRLLPRLPVGAPVIFQDFGWYTCFWISSAVHALRDCLTLTVRADSTYAFRLSRAVSAEEIARRFTRTPEAMGQKFFSEAAAALLERSRVAGDLRGELIAHLHHVAALVTIGCKPQAAKVLQGLDVRRYAAHANMIRGCIKSPTYLPGNRQILWEDKT